MKRDATAEHPQSVADSTESGLVRAASCRRAGCRHGLIAFVSVLAAVLCVYALVLSGLGLVGCGPGYPPNDYIIDPPVAFDGLGNVFTAYQVNLQERGPVTYVQKLGPDGDRLWGEKGVQLDVRQPELQTREDPRASPTYLVSDAEGRVTVLWVFGGEVFAKKLDGSGNPVWSSQPLAVSALMDLEARDDGGATIASRDTSHVLRLQTIGGDGSLLWSELPTITNVGDVDIACDDSGDTWVVWSEPYTERIQLQVFNKAGRAAWAEAQLLKPGLQTPAQAPGIGKYGLVVIPNESGGALVCWGARWDDTGLDARSVDGDGRLLWSVTNESFQLGLNDILTAKVAGDDRGGLYAAWRTGNMLRAQHIDGQGNALWSEGGVGLAEVMQRTGSELFDYVVSRDNAGGLLVGWNNYSAGHPIYAQHLDAAGNQLWPTTGVTVGMVAVPRGWSITPSNTAVFFSSGTWGSGKSHVQKLDPDGQLPWGQEGIRLDDWRESSTGATSKMP